MSHSDALSRGLWRSASLDFVRSGLGTSVVGELGRNVPGQSRAAVDEYWFQNRTYFAHFTHEYIAGAILMLCNNINIATAVAAVVFHESGAKPLSYYSSSFTRGVRTKAEVISRPAEIGLGLGQVTDMFHKAWLRATPTHELGRHLRNEVGENSNCHILPLVCLAIIAERIEQLTLKYGSVEEALYRYAGKNRAASAAEYAAKPSSLTAFMKTPFAQSVRHAFGDVS